MAKYWYDHVHLMSPDPPKTAQFYEQMFGAKRGDVRTFPDGRISVPLDLNGQSILILQPKDRTKSTTIAAANNYGLEHFGIRTDNLEAAVKDLKAKGVKFQQDVTVPRPGIKIAFLWAPENVLIELVERTG
jgi:catechol 2,3-dioxygenase-like lactoylglutathione lyase family enzyme